MTGGEDRTQTTAAPAESETEAVERGVDHGNGASVVALVGATGGAGTTRIALETGALLSRAGERVAVFDAALGTQGLADHVEGRIDADVVDLVTEDGVAPADVLVERTTAGDGSLHVAPARAPFAGIARAKTETAARTLESTLRAAAGRFDRVLVDTPPVAANQAVASVSAADRVGVVAPATARGVDAVQRVRGRIEDVGATVTATVGNRAPPGETVAEPFDAVVPVHEGAEPEEVPVADEAAGAFVAGVAAVTQVVVGVDPDVEVETNGFLDRLR